MTFFNAVFEFLQKLVSIPAFPRPVPEIGWLGVVAIATWLGWAVAGLRSTILVVVTMLLFGVFGLWQDSIDLLLVTIIAVVFCFVVGLPTGILMARSRAISAVVTPVLDIMQTMPPFAYLAPVALRLRDRPDDRHRADLHLRAAPDGPDHRARHPGCAGRPPSRQRGRWA